MTPAINMQCLPTPEIWHDPGPVKPYAITDETSTKITDENGTVILED